MTFEYVKDENGKIVDITVNGKPVKRGSMRGFRKAQNCSYFKILNVTRTFANPFSGVEVELNPLEATVYNWCWNWYQRYEAGMTGDNEIQMYDDMKYFLLELNSQAYMDLID
jgi:hypothetical protein